MRPFARRVTAYVRSVGSNPTLSFGGDGYIVLSPNSNKNFLGSSPSAALTYKWLQSDWTSHDCMATYILGKL